MKFQLVVSLLTAVSSSVDAFMPSLAPYTAFTPSLSQSHNSKNNNNVMRPKKCSQLFMSDFASAMPEKPALSTEELMAENADKYIAYIRGSLGEGVEAVPEVQALEDARENGADQKEITQKIYELMIEQGMTYDLDEMGVMTPTQFDIKANLDDPVVQDEFKRLYEYGMKLCKSGLLSTDTVKEIVLKRLIERTGLSPEKFDEWLGY